MSSRANPPSVPASPASPAGRAVTGASPSAVVPTRSPTTMLTRVKSKLFVHARRRSRGLLEGEYASVFHGRSLDYDDLRDYVIGDEVRDIDWKATARHTKPLVKRYVAHRKQKPDARGRHRSRNGGHHPQR